MHILGLNFRARSFTLLLPLYVFAPEISLYVLHLYRKIRVQSVQLLWPRRKPQYTIYQTPEAEQKYWDTAEKYRKRLDISDERRCKQNPPFLLRYYTPALLPAYRDRKKTDFDSLAYTIPAKTFCKWHRMVFRGPVRLFA